MRRRPAPQPAPCQRPTHLREMGRGAVSAPTRARAARSGRGRTPSHQGRRVGAHRRNQIAHLIEKYPWRHCGLPRAERGQDEAAAKRQRQGPAARQRRAAMQVRLTHAPWHRRHRSRQASAADARKPPSVRGVALYQSDMPCRPSSAPCAAPLATPCGLPGCLHQDQEPPR